MPDTIKSRKKNYTYFIGVDVSKNELDYAVLRGNKFLFHREDRNDAESIAKFIVYLKGLPGFTIAKAIFCMENTGIYCNHLLSCLKKIKANAVVENAYHIKNSFGLVRGKDDKTDAINIATYAQKNKDQLKLWAPKRPVILALANLSALRSRLLGASVSIKVAVTEQEKFITAIEHHRTLQFCQKSTEAITADLHSINMAIEKLIDTDEHLKRLRNLIISVPGIGIVTALQIIISTNEFLDIHNPRQFACYAGVAPFKTESGTVTRKPKVSYFANKKIKALLHLCAISAIKSDPAIKTYYERKTQADGKAKMSVINAIKNKMILMIFACVNQNRMYIRNYDRQSYKETA